MLKHETPGGAYRAGAGLSPQQWWEVAAPPAELAAACAKLIAVEGVLSAEQLQVLAGQIAGAPELWKPLSVEDPERRRYRLLYEDDRIDVWVLSWMAGQATGFHDHDVSAVGLACASGAVVERQLLLPSGTSEVRMTAGVSRMGPQGYIHAVDHADGAPAVTIHAYSPPLAQVGQYRVDDDGILRREIAHGRQELLDHSIADLVE